MVETLMEAIYQTYKHYFEGGSKSRNSLSDGWSRVAFEINRIHGHKLTVEQIKTRHSYCVRNCAIISLQGKYR